MMNNYNKYLKYKSKYLELKSKGGDVTFKSSIKKETN
jgi:hypothetical protein